MVSIHAPRAGRDVAMRAKACMERLFQSTRPVRGATAAELKEQIDKLSFNPRAPCGARPGSDGMRTRAEAVSIHAPRAGRDSIPRPKTLLIYLFQSTRPVRGATRYADER